MLSLTFCGMQPWEGEAVAGILACQPALSMHLGKTFPLSQLSTERLGQGW